MSIELHRLHIGDGEDGIHEVGRADTGIFVALPEAGVTILRWLDMGLPVGDVITRFTAAYGTAPELADFIDGLVDCGFVKSFNGEPISAPKVQERPAGWRLLGNVPVERVRWILSPPYVAFYRLVWIAVPVILVFRTDLFPRPSDALVSSRPMLNVLVLAALGWSTALLHEAAHILAARARGASSSLSLGRRLYILVTQTDMSGVRALPRAQRNAPYLAGMTLNMVIVLACLLLQIATGDKSVIAAVAYISMLQILFQFAIFLRTDLYYVVTNLLRVNNLAEGTRLVLKAALHRLVGGPPVDLSTIPPRERHVLRWYAPCHVLGIVLAMVNLVIFVLPVPVTMGRAAIATLIGTRTGTPRWEAAAFLLVVGFELGSVIVIAAKERLGRKR